MTYVRSRARHAFKYCRFLPTGENHLAGQVGNGYDTDCRDIVSSNFQPRDNADPSLSQNDNRDNGRPGCSRKVAW